MKRWLKQKLGWEMYNYKPTFKGLLQMFLWLNSDLKKQKRKIEQLENDSKELLILNRKKVNDLVKTVSLDD